MENAIDAIKIAFGLIVFAIAVALSVFVIGQARVASEVIFHLNDKSEFYDYATSSNIEHTENRIVGLETILPTIHRYAKEQFAVTIFDKSGNPIVRYDLWTEGFMTNWNQVLKNKDVEGSTEKQSYDEVKERLQRVQNVVNTTIPGLNKNKEFDMNNLNNLYRVSSSANPMINVGAPWIGDNEKILARVKTDMLGTTYSNNLITYQGKNLQSYKEKKFIEKFLEISTSGTTITDEEYSLETVKGNKKLEIIYILQE